MNANDLTLCSMTTKLGAARRVPRSRLWIEGARLAAAGFVQGARFDLSRTGSGLTLSLSPFGARKVSGKDGHPIIDITGDLIRTTFAGDRVACSFKPQQIIVSEA